MSDPVWYCVLDGQSHGPLTSEALQRLAAGGVLRPADLVFDAREQAWVPAGGVSGLTFPGPPAEPPEQRQEEHWFYGVAGRAVGPVRWGELRRLAAAGAVRPTDPVRHWAAGAWGPAADVPGLAFPLPADSSADAAESPAVAGAPPEAESGGEGSPVPVGRRLAIATGGAAVAAVVWGAVAVAYAWSWPGSRDYPPAVLGWPVCAALTAWFAVRRSADWGTNPWVALIAATLTFPVYGFCLIIVVSWSLWGVWVQAGRWCPHPAWHVALTPLMGLVVGPVVAAINRRPAPTRPSPPGTPPVAPADVARSAVVGGGVYALAAGVVFLYWKLNPFLAPAWANLTAFGFLSRYVGGKLAASLGSLSRYVSGWIATSQGRKGPPLADPPRPSDGLAPAPASRWLRHATVPALVAISAWYTVAVPLAVMHPAWIPTFPTPWACSDQPPQTPSGPKADPPGPTPVSPPAALVGRPFTPTEAKKVESGLRLSVGQRLLAETHPTGRFTGALTIVLAEEDGRELYGWVTVAWDGGVTGQPYETVFAYTFTRSSVSLWVMSDTSAFQVDPGNLRRAEQWLAAKYADVQAGK